MKRRDIRETKKSDWPLIMTQAFIWKGNGHLLVYYRLLHECTICTMLERVELRLAGGEQPQGSGGGVEVVLYFVVL